MEIVPVLLRSVVRDGAVSTVSSDPGFEPPPFSELELRDLAKRIPQNGRYALLQITTSSGVATAAARIQGDEFFFFLLKGEGAERLATIPAFCLSRGDRLPLATPAAVAMLGYTPWELAGGDFLKGFTGSPTGQSSLVPVLDRWGRRHELIHMPVRQSDGSVWITVTPVPDTLASGWEGILASWVSRPASSAVSELESALEAIGANGGALFERQGDSYALVASRNSPVSQEDLAPGGLLSSAGAESSEWLDTGGEGAGGHLYIKAFGRSDGFLGVFGGAASPVTVESRASVVLPVLAIRLDLSASLRADMETKSRKAVLESIEKMLQERGTSSWLELGAMLDDIASRTGAARMDVIPQPAETAIPVPVAAQPAESQDSTTVDVRMRGGRILRVGFDSPSHADMRMARAVARIFERFCHRDAPAAARDVHPGGWRTVQIEGFRVVWQPEGSSLPACFSFYGREAPCDDCPVTRGNAGRQGVPSSHLRDGWIEEIMPTGTGHSVRWTRWMADPSDPGTEKLPGGAAVYGRSGEVVSWNGWMETVSGVGPSSARGQGASRLLDRMAGPRVVRQLELAMGGVFLPDSVEVTLPGGRRCFSKMIPGAGKDTIAHFLIDARSAGIEEVQILAGPGAAGAEGEPSSLRTAMEGVCEIYGWDLIASDDSSPESTEVWLSAPALSEYLLDLLKQMAPTMPERKASLSTAFVPEGRPLAGRPVLPAIYGMVGFRTYPVLLPVHQQMLAGLEREIAGLGGWMARSGEQGRDEVVVALPIVGRDLGERRRITLYSADDWFTGEIEAVTSGLPERFCLASNLTDLAEMQLSSRALVLRPRPGEAGLVSCLAARVPGQPIILATGVKPRIPVTVSSVMHLQTPATRDELLMALRRMIVA